MQHCYEDKNTEECKDDAQRNLRGDDVARRPLRHLEGVRRLRGEDEHGDKRRDEREVVEGEERERAPRLRLTRYECEDRDVDLPRAECIEKRHEERAAEASKGDSRAAPALHRNLPYEHLHTFRQLQRHDGEDWHLPELQRIAEAQERQDEQRKRENNHHYVVDDAQTFKSLQGLHESEAHQHVGDERSGAERKSAEDSRLALAPADGEDSGKGNHDRKGTGVESVDNSREDDGRKCPMRRRSCGSTLDGRTSHGNVDYRTFWIVAKNLDVLRELAREHRLEGDRKCRGGTGLDAHR